MIREREWERESLFYIFVFFFSYWNHYNAWCNAFSSIFTTFYTFSEKKLLSSTYFCIGFYVANVLCVWCWCMLMYATNIASHLGLCFVERVFVGFGYFFFSFYFRKNKEENNLENRNNKTLFYLVSSIIIIFAV